MIIESFKQRELEFYWEKNSNWNPTSRTNNTKVVMLDVQKDQKFIFRRVESDNGKDMGGVLDICRIFPKGCPLMKTSVEKDVNVPLVAWSILRDVVKGKVELNRIKFDGRKSEKFRRVTFEPARNKFKFKVFFPCFLCV